MTHLTCASDVILRYLIKRQNKYLTSNIDHVTQLMQNFYRKRVNFCNHGKSKRSCHVEKGKIL